MSLPRSFASIIVALSTFVFVAAQQAQPLENTEFSQVSGSPVLETAIDANAKAANVEQSYKVEPTKALRQRRLEQCLAENYTVTLSADELRPWSIMHGILAYGLNATVVTQGHYVNSVDYLCANGRGDDRRILSLQNQQLFAAKGRGVQGHEGQLLAILAQVGVPSDKKLNVDGREFTVQDLVRYQQAKCRSRSELTFTLIGLAHYLDSDELWRDDMGQGWNIPRLIHEEITQPINGSACGGLHRLMGLSFALETRRQRGEPVNGQWQRVAHFVQSYQKRALDYQNADGSFSTEWFDGPGNRSDLARRIYTTGHTLEWLVFSLPDDQLESSPMLRAVDAMISMLRVEASTPRQLHGFDVGPKGHALRALRLFEERVYGTPSDHQQLANLSDKMLAPYEAFKLQARNQFVESTPNKTVATPVSFSNKRPQPVTQPQPVRRSRFGRR